MSKYIIANFKMNGSTDFFEAYIQTLQKTFCSLKPDLTPIFCPPFPYLTLWHTWLKNLEHGHAIYLGGQDCSAFQDGKPTGDISCSMLKDLGARYVIIGHSERRERLHESSNLIQNKILCAIDADLIPILCVGETLEAHQNGRSRDVIMAQIHEAGIFQLSSRCMVAYEPLWAIGTGKTPTPEMIEETLFQIHSHFTQEQSHQKHLLYGGSVNRENLDSFLKISTLDGVLIGGFALNACNFIQHLSASSNQ
jgi:triosephosphate isomerase